MYLHFLNYIACPTWYFGVECAENNNYILFQLYRVHCRKGYSIGNHRFQDQLVIPTEVFKKKI
jgi:hypothetical protein